MKELQSLMRIGPHLHYSGQHLYRPKPWRAGLQFIHQRILSPHFLCCFKRSNAFKSDIQSCFSPPSPPLLRSNVTLVIEVRALESHRRVTYVFCSLPSLVTMARLLPGQAKRRVVSLISWLKLSKYIRKC